MINHAVPHALEMIVGRSLAGDRRLRYPSPNAVAGDVRRFLAERTTRMDREEVGRTMREMFPERRHPSESPGMRTHPEVLALVTETDGQAPEDLKDEHELPSIVDEAPASSTQPD